MEITMAATARGVGSPFAAPVSSAIVSARAASVLSSANRARALPGYLRWYNTHRTHGTTGVPPLNRISQAQGSYS